MSTICKTCAYQNLYTYRCQYCKSVYDDTGTYSEYVKDSSCHDYIGVACIDGTCPNALENWITVPCGDCFYYKGCEDCAAPEMGLCDKPNKAPKKGSDI